ncbi:OmpA family protein [Vibrio sp.]|nr:OmpA family protein [Vibrio sp.]
MLCINQEYYLFQGFYTQSYDIEEDRDIFHSLNNRNDLTSNDGLFGIRPVPFVPVISLSEAVPQFMATNQYGMLMRMSLGKTSDERSPIGESSDSGDVNALNDRDILHPMCAERSLKEGEHELLFPPIKLLAQMIDPYDVDPIDIANQLQSFAESIPQSDGKGSKFALTKILPNQLAPPYQAEGKQDLTEQQKAYNDFYDDCQQDPSTPLQGFLLPVFNSCAVLFSDPLYAGAEVSLVRSVDQLDVHNPQQSEQVVAKTTVILPEDEMDSDRSFLACALLELPESDLKDDYYLLRVRFWEQDYEEANRTSLPKSVLNSAIKKEFSDDNGERAPQNVYTYELHEQLNFKQAGAMGKIAMVCGDMITLEESIIHQFPSRLPDFSQYRATQITTESERGSGLGGLALSTTIQRVFNEHKNTAIEEMDLSHIKGMPKEIAGAIGQAIIQHVNEGQIPEALAATTAFTTSLAAFKDAQKQMKSAIRLYHRPLSAALIKQRLIKHYLVDTAYVKRILRHMPQDTFGTVGRVSSNWKTIMPRALPVLETGMSLIDFYDQYCDTREYAKDAEEALAKLDVVAEQHLKKVTYVKTQDSQNQWQDKAEKLKETLGDEAKIKVDQRGVALHFYFQFNSSSESNKVEVMHNNFASICDTLRNALKDNPNYQLLIEGHAGVIGTTDANQIVSQRRADFVRKKIQADESSDSFVSRIHSIAYGKSRRLSTPEEEAKANQSDTSENAQDRRVEIRMYIPDFSLTLPPSRSGLSHWDSQLQSWQGFRIKQEDAEDDMMLSAVNATMGAMLLVPMVAPLAGAYFVAKAGMDLGDSAGEAFDAWIGQGHYQNIKTVFKNKEDLGQITKLNKEILRKYAELNQKIEGEFDSAEALSDHLDKQLTKDELTKRYLLRAYSINCLVELLVRIAYREQLWLDRDELLEKYHLDAFIRTYIMNDNWQIMTLNANSLALNWMNERTSPQTKALSAQDNKPYLQGRQDLNHFQVGGAFNTGFPVQTALFFDKEGDALKSFSRDFDLTEQELSSNDIGFSRVLVFDDEANHWRTYLDWRDNAKHDPKTGPKLGPFTRVMVQVILTKEADVKSTFNVKLQYRMERAFSDVYGPTFDLMMSSFQAESFTSTGRNTDSDEAIEAYYEEQGADGESLIALEFEPNYWFSYYQIPGIKPLFNERLKDIPKALLTGTDIFDVWKESYGHEEMAYYFTLNSNQVRAHSHIEMDQKGLLNSKGRMKESHHLLDYGMFERINPKPLYDGENLAQATLCESDMLFKEFMEVMSADENEVPKILQGNVITRTALRIGNKVKLLKNWSNETERQPLSWDQPEKMSLYTVVLGDKALVEEYQEMDRTANKVPVELTVMNQDGDRGMGYSTQMHHQGSLTVLDSLVVDEDATSSTYGGMVKATYRLERTDDDEQPNIADPELQSEFDTVLQGVIDDLKGENTGIQRSERMYVYIARFELDYVAPTGERLDGLRPFGSAINKDALSPQAYRFTSLYQHGQKEPYELEGHTVNWQQESSFFEQKPWAKHDIAQIQNRSAYRHWLSMDEQQRKAWVKDWIVNKPMLRRAPQPKLMQA